MMPSRSSSRSSRRVTSSRAGSPAVWRTDMTTPIPSTALQPRPGELSALQKDFLQPLITAINRARAHRASLVAAACQGLLHGITPDERTRVLAYFRSTFQQGLN